MKYYITLSCVIFSVGIAFSQQKYGPELYAKHGDSLYQHHHYHLAIRQYEKALKKNPMLSKAILGMARSYRKINHNNEALKWFEKAEESGFLTDPDDRYAYAQVLLSQGKKDRAKEKLEGIVTLQADHHATHLLRDMEADHLWKDTTQIWVGPVTINSSNAEFAPAFFKDGIVFSSGRPNGHGKKKYHWDNSFYLDLYFSKINKNESMGAPVLFDKSLQSAFHDGPVTFYNGNKNAILTRNTPGKNNQNTSSLYHLSMYTCTYDELKKIWSTTPISFGDPGYSFGHPSIDENGTTLVFASNKAGGQGDTDLYISRKNGDQWGVPTSLNDLNTPGNEMFPFAKGDTLYFASDGHGGLGGLDVYYTVLMNGKYTKPVNLGAPVNSEHDDFALITRDHLTGYFSSSRNGNDDIFFYRRKEARKQLIAHIFEKETNIALPGAEVRMMTLTGEDVVLTTDENGNTSFTTDATSFILLAVKDGWSGLYTYDKGIETDSVLQIPVIKDGAINVIGKVMGKSGEVISDVIIKMNNDLKEEVQLTSSNGLLSFRGEKGKKYEMSLEASGYETRSIQLEIPEAADQTFHWTMELRKENDVRMTARVFKAEDNSVMAYSPVQVITFDKKDEDYTTDGNGELEFSLPLDEPFVLIAAGENFSGMYQDISRSDIQRPFIIPVPVRGDKLSIPAVGTVVSSSGDKLDNYIFKIIDTKTGKVVESTDGLLSFMGQKGHTYDVTVEASDFGSQKRTISIPQNAQEAFSFKIDMSQEQRAQTLVARVFKAENKQVLPGAKAQVITFDNIDNTFIADNKGEFKFDLPEGEPFIVIATSGQHIGLYQGIADEQIQYPKVVPISAKAESQGITAVAKVINSRGEAVSGYNIIVKEQGTGNIVLTSSQAGLSSFTAKKGVTYTVVVEGDNFTSVQKYINVPSGEDVSYRFDIIADEQIAIPSYIVKVIKEDDGAPLAEAHTRLIVFGEDDLEGIADKQGKMDLTIPQDAPFMIIASRDNYSGLYSGDEVGNKKEFIISTSTDMSGMVSLIGIVTDGTGQPANFSTLVIQNESTGKTLEYEVKNGFILAQGVKGEKYKVTARMDGQPEKTVYIETGGDKRNVHTWKLQLQQAANGLDLVAIRNYKEKSQAFLLLDEGCPQIIENEGQLFFKDSNLQSLGKGSVKEDKALIAAVENTMNTKVDIIHHIYPVHFDFDSHKLTDTAKVQLKKVQYLLNVHTDLNLGVSAHADDRGRPRYNLRLSRKRAAAIAQFLGLPSRRVTTIPRGEESPVVDCRSGDCSEQDHYKNRRAEFILTASPMVVDSVVAKTKAAIAANTHGDPARSSAGYDFKVALGAYRYNDKLDFKEFQDLGKIEKVKSDGLTYYFLAGARSYENAQRLRQEVVKRGIQDATVVIYKGKQKVSYENFAKR